MATCACGCGQVVRAGNRFLHGHNARGEGNAKWNGGRSTNRGYVFVYMPSHPRANARGYVPEHVLVVEKALGRPFNQPHEVHHFNHDRSDNRGCNLVLCEDRAYHMLLEHRQRALVACGNPDWRACTICHEWDDPANMAPHRTRGGRHSDRFYHRLCAADYQLRRYHARKARTN